MQVDKFEEHTYTYIHTQTHTHEHSREHLLKIYIFGARTISTWTIRRRLGYTLRTGLCSPFCLFLHLPIALSLCCVIVFRINPALCNNDFTTEVRISAALLSDVISVVNFVSASFSWCSRFSKLTYYENTDKIKKKMY